MIFKNIKYMYCNDNIYENLLWNHLFFFWRGDIHGFLRYPSSKRIIHPLKKYRAHCLFLNSNKLSVFELSLNATIFHH